MATTTPTSLVRDRKHTPPTLQTIDVDLHQHIANWRDVAPYAPQGLRHRLARPGGPPLARHGFKIIGPRFGDAPRPTDANGKAGHPAADPPWVKAQYPDKRGGAIALPTWPGTGLRGPPNP